MLRNRKTYCAIWVYTSDDIFSTTLVKSNSKPLQCSIYPNPASGIVHVDRLEYRTSYSITDAIGREVLNGKLDPGNRYIVIEMLSDGIYFIELSDLDDSRAIARFEKK